jgi:hypothetical protein
MKAPKSFIVKVQLSLGSTEPNRQMLLYNEDHSVIWQADAPKNIIEAMDGKPKAFFNATLKGTIIHLGTKAQRQDW